MNLAAIIDPHPADAAALITRAGEVTTYGELRRGVARVHQELVDAGITAGDRVALLSANDPAFAVGYLAILRAGAVAVPLNIVSPPAEVNGQLAQVDVAAILVGPGGRHLSAAIGSLTGALVLPVTGAEGHTAAGGDGGAGGTGDDAGSLPEMVAREREDPAALLFTAGTAGAPRAAVLTHGNLLANLDQVQRHPGRAIEARDRILGVLPLCHIFGLNAVLGGALYVGAAVVLLERFDAVGTLEVIAGQRITIVVGAPTLFAALAAAPSPRDDPTATVRLAFCGAAPLSTEVAEAWQKRFGNGLRQGYGLTEASPVVTNAVMDEPARPSSIGVPLPGVEVRLVDDEGEEALAGDPGEIWVRGPNVFPGYWRDPEATSTALSPDGWLRTGDIAVVGDDGQLAIVDRAKDLIIVSGFNVYPAEVEEVLGEHPGVSDVAVIGDVDRSRGEVVHAFVVLKDPGVGTAELSRWCETRLAGYKCPREFTVVASLPHGLAGKLLRRSLRSAMLTAPGAAPA